MVKRPDLLASKAVALSPPSDGLLGRWELRTVTKYGTKRFHESVWNDSDIYIYNWCNEIYCNQFRCNVIQKFSWTEVLTKPLQFSCHVTLPLPIPHVEVLCQGFWVEALRGSTSWSLSLKRCRKSLRSFQLGTVFSSGTCHKRRSDGDRPEFGHPHESSQVLEGSGQKHQLLLVQFLPISISRGILPLNGLVLVTVDHPSKLRHGSQRFLWCCYSSRGRKNFEVDLGEISWNNVKA